MFKIHNGFSQVSFLDLLHNYHKNNVHDLRSQPDFQIANLQINITLKRIESVRYFGAVIWNNILVEIFSSMGLTFPEISASVLMLMF